MQLDDVLTELVADSGDRLLRVAYQLTHDRMAAQDLVQDALLRVYRSVRRRGLAPQDWYAYLRRAVVNEYIRTRRLRSSTKIVTATLPERPAAVSLEDRAADQEQLWTALGELSERQRAVLVLRYYEGLPDHEIAGLLSCREASVRSLARRGLTAMRPLVTAASTVRTAVTGRQSRRARPAAQLAGSPPPRPADRLHSRRRSADQLPHRPALPRRRQDVGRCHRRAQPVRRRIQRRVHQLRHHRPRRE
jgi:RNA polymerase sigma factor (sigma-70 family)